MQEPKKVWLTINLPPGLSPTGRNREAHDEQWIADQIRYSARILQRGSRAHGKRKAGKDWIRAKALEQGFPFRFACAVTSDRGYRTFEVNSLEELEKALEEVYGR